MDALLTDREVARLLRRFHGDSWPARGGSDSRRQLAEALAAGRLSVEIARYEPVEYPDEIPSEVGEERRVWLRSQRGGLMQAGLVWEMYWWLRARGEEDIKFEHSFHGQSYRADLYAPGSLTAVECGNTDPAKAVDYLYNDFPVRRFILAPFREEDEPAETVVITKANGNDDAV